MAEDGLSDQIRIKPNCVRVQHLITTKKTCCCFNCGYDFNPFFLTSVIHVKLREHYLDGESGPGWLGNG